MEITPLMGGIGNYYGPMEFRANRPFLFYMIDRDNGNIPLFMGRIHNPINNRVKIQNRNKASHELKTSAFNAHRNGLSNPIIVENVPTKTIPSALRQPTRYRPINFDSVNFPNQNLNFYNNPSPRSSNGFIPQTSSLQDQPSDPIIFPEDDYTINRFRERRGDTITNKPMTTTPTSNDTLNTRIKDSHWFNRPTFSEVLIPIHHNNPHDSVGLNHQRPSVTSIESHHSHHSQNSGGLALPASSGLSPMESTPSSSTIPPNIIQAQITNHPTLITINSWQNNMGGPPGFAPIHNIQQSTQITAAGSPTNVNKLASQGTDLHFPSHIPTFASPENPSGILFPEFRFSKKYE